MTNEQYSQVEELFAELMELSQAERALRVAAIEDIVVRKEVESLLTHAGEDRTAFDGLVGRMVVAASEAGEFGERAAGPGTRFGPYRIERRLGQGGMGDVYAAVREDAFHKRVALKVVRFGLDSEFAQKKFAQERQVLANLEHAFIARLLDGGEQNGCPYLILEYVEGRPIDEYCKGRPREEVLRLFLKVCDAVEYAHQNLVIHRDLKPDNILVAEDGSPKLLDFGIAKLMEEDVERTKTGFASFTPQYASPEQVRGERITTRTDVYCLGLVLYELLTSKRPYQLTSNTATEMDRVICQTEVPRPHISEDLDNILLMAMRKDPLRRYASVREFAADIERSLQHQPVLARADTLRYRAGKFVRRHWIGVIAASVVTVAIIAGGVSTEIQRRRAERRFEQVRRLANTFLFDFDKEILNIPGTTKARELLVKTALEYLDSLSAEAHQDRALRLELATAYLRVGGVQGYPSRPNLGQEAAAKISYQKAIALIEPQFQKGIATKQELRALNEGFESLSMLSGQGHRGSKERLAGLEKSIAIGRLICSTQPVTVDDYNTVAAPLVELGHLELGDGKVNEAEAHFEEALQMRQKAAQVEPSAKGEWWVAGSMVNVARTRRLAGDLDTAFDRLTKATERLKKAIELEPKNGRYERMLYTFTDLESELHGSKTMPSFGNLHAAQESAKRALEMAERSLQRDPHSVLARFDVISSLLRNASYSMERDPKAAERWINSALEICDRIRTEGKGLQYLRGYESEVKAMLGESLVRQGKSDQGLVLVKQQRAAEQEDIEKDHRPPSEDLVRTYRVEARALLQQGKREQALQQLQIAQKLASEAVQAQPNDLGPVVVLSRCYRELAESTGSAEWNQREADIWKEWNAKHQAYRYSKQQQAAAVARLNK